MGIILFACNHGSPGIKSEDIQISSGNADTSIAGYFNEPQKDENSDNKKAGENKDAAPGKDNFSNNPGWDKKIIKTAELQLQVDDFKKFNTNIHSSIKNFGAYITDEKQSEDGYRIENSVTIKVPSDQFDALVNSFGGEGIKLLVKNISSEDVTGEMVDTKARMQAKMAVRDKYLELLKQAKNMNDILQVQDEINSIQEDIESAKGRVNYLQHASAYSTVNLDYFQYINGNTGDYENPGFVSKFFKAFSEGTTLISKLVLACISIWPLFLIVILGMVYFKKFRQRKPVKA